MNSPLSICIIGRGNVATHLAKAFCSAARLTHVSSRTLEGMPQNADIYIISVSDNAIESVSRRIAGVRGLVAHTSGSVGIEALDEHPRRGVFYPMQTFSKDVELTYSEIPLFLEADSEASYRLLEQAARIISDYVYPADSSIRARMHLAAVFSCNFVNRLFAIADDILAGESIPFSTLRPLVAQTVKKAFTLPHPADGQTGPAARGDTGVIDYHMAALASMPDSSSLREIYSVISDDILRASGKSPRNK